MRTLKLFTANGTDLTFIRSRDGSITLPTEIHERADGSWVACHADSGDVEYPHLPALCEAYKIDRDDVRAEFDNK
jgi:hypothetical protein